MTASSTAAADPANQAAAIVEIDATGQTDPAVQSRALAALEAGHIIYLPDAFRLSERERALVADASVTLPTKKERESQNGRPTIIFDPDRGRILGRRSKGAQRAELEALCARYAAWAQETMFALFPGYKEGLVRDRTTYRPCERAAPQGLHVDASYGRPTGGRGMLRLFCNINPQGRPRVWRVGEPFEAFAQRFVPSARLKPQTKSDRFLGRLGLTYGQRTAYDRLMEDIRGQAKRDRHYQAQSPQKIVEFPVGSAWLAITDLVLHAAVSGQHSLDQTFFLPPQTMAQPEHSSLNRLERLARVSLA
jgi:hypothetical protein